MAWKLDKNGVRPSVPLSETEQDNLNIFMNKVREGEHPKDAADAARCEYKKLKGSANQYEIYLSIRNRATFTVNETDKIVTMLQVGGHT